MAKRNRAEWGIGLNGKGNKSARGVPTSRGDKTLVGASDENFDEYLRRPKMFTMSVAGLGAKVDEDENPLKSSKPPKKRSGSVDLRSEIRRQVREREKASASLARNQASLNKDLDEAESENEIDPSEKLAQDEADTFQTAMREFYKQRSKINKRAKQAEAEGEDLRSEEEQSSEDEQGHDSASEEEISSATDNINEDHKSSSASAGSPSLSEEERAAASKGTRDETNADEKFSSTEKVASAGSPLLSKAERAAARKRKRGEAKAESKARQIRKMKRELATAQANLQKVKEDRLRDEAERDHLNDLQFHVIQLLSDIVIRHYPKCTFEQAATLANSVFTVAMEMGQDPKQLMEDQLAAGILTLPVVNDEPIFMRGQNLRSPQNNIALRTISLAHPTFLSAWPDQAALLPKDFVYKMSSLIPTVTMEVQTYVANGGMITLDSLFHPAMKKQIHHDLQTKLDVLQRANPGTVGSELALFASYWKQGLTNKVWTTADHFFRKDFNYDVNGINSPYNDLLKLYPANLTASSKVQNKMTAYENAIVNMWKIQPPQLHIPACSQPSQHALKELLSQVDIEFVGATDGDFTKLSRIQSNKLCGELFKKLQKTGRDGKAHIQRYAKYLLRQWEAEKKRVQSPSSDYKDLDFVTEFPPIDWILRYLWGIEKEGISHFQALQDDGFILYVEEEKHAASGTHYPAAWTDHKKAATKGDTVAAAAITNVDASSKTPKV